MDPSDQREPVTVKRLARPEQLRMASNTFMITSSAVPAPLLPDHRRVSPRHALHHDFAGALRDKVVTTAAGDLTVKIAKVRTGSFFPARSATAANTCQPTPPRPSHNYPHANRPAGRRPPERSWLVRPTTSRRPTPTPAASARCPGSSLTSSAQEYLSPLNLTDRAGRSPPSDRGEHRCGEPGRRWSGFAHPGAASDQDQGGGQAQHDAGVDTEFEQGVTQCAGGFVPGQGQSGADGADLPGTDDPDDQKWLKLGNWSGALKCPAL